MSNVGEMWKNISQTKKDIDAWASADNRRKRYELLDDLAAQAGIQTLFRQVPMLHWENMDYDKFMINVYAMTKIIRGAD